jgi:integrase
MGIEMGKREHNRLSPAAVNRLKKTKVDRKTYLADGAGLYVQLTPGEPGGRSWVFRYEHAGRRHEMGLGSLFTILPSEAREKAATLRKRLQALREGEVALDPLEQRREAQQRAKVAAAKAMTFRQCAQAFMVAKAPEWSNLTHAQQWPQSLRDYVFPTIGDLPVAAIDVGLVMKTLEPIWTTRPETASRVRGRIESVLDWATARKHREGPNPAQWKGNLAHMLAAPAKMKRIEHHAALPYTEIAEFMAELRQQGGIAARALEFAILTAARTGEVIGARWAEVNVAEQLWTIPGSRMKAGKEHRVPLSDAAMAIVEQMPRESDFLFPGTRPGRPINDRALFSQVRLMGRSDFTVHGFRSCFRDWAAERTSFPAEVAEMALAHSVGSKVEVAYRRSDLFAKRRQLAEAWARYCAAGPADGGKVVAIGVAR